MTSMHLKHRIEKKELQFSALLEITQAINHNVSEESLYKIFNFILRSNLNIAKMALYVLDKTWECKISFGTTHDFTHTALADQFKRVKKTRHMSNFPTPVFSEFDILMPVIHKNNTLALLFAGRMDNSQSDDENIQFLQLLSNIIIVAIQNKQLVRKQLKQEALRKELEIAGNMQHFLFPEKLPNTDRLTIEASYVPHNMVGGDYYDYIQISEDQFLICIADVSGKGMPAAIIMSNFQASLHTILRHTSTLSEIVDVLNYQVLKNTKGEKFITCFTAIYDFSSKTLTYVNSGHNPPFLYTAKQKPILLDQGSTILGIIHPLPFLDEKKITNLDEFFLFAYTDGLTETVNKQQEQFGTHHLTHFLSNNYREKPKIIHQNLIDRLDEFKEDKLYADDITMLSCRIRNKDKK